MKSLENLGEIQSMRKNRIKKPRLAPEHPVAQLLEAGDSQRVALGQILCIDYSVMQQK